MQTQKSTSSEDCGEEETSFNFFETDGAISLSKRSSQSPRRLTEDPSVPIRDRRNEEYDSCSLIARSVEHTYRVPPTSPHF